MLSFFFHTLNFTVHLQYDLNEVICQTLALLRHLNSSCPNDIIMMNFEHQYRMSFTVHCDKGDNIWTLMVEAIFSLLTYQVIISVTTPAEGINEYALRWD